MSNKDNTSPFLTQCLDKIFTILSATIDDATPDHLKKTYSGTGHPWWQKSFNLQATHVIDLKHAIDLLSNNGTKQPYKHLISPKTLKLIRHKHPLLLEPITQNDLDELIHLLSSERRAILILIKASNRIRTQADIQRDIDAMHKSGIASNMSRFIANKATRRFRTGVNICNAWIKNLSGQESLSTLKPDIDAYVEDFFKDVYSEKTPLDEVPTRDELRRKDFHRMINCAPWILDILKSEQVPTFEDAPPTLELDEFKRTIKKWGTQLQEHLNYPPPF
jgi:hypothetical protein